MSGELKPCPFCGEPLFVRRGVNPYGRCETEGCWMCERKMTVPLDNEAQVAAWNTRATPSQGLDAKEGGEADEYMSVTIDRDGNVTSHNAYDANFDEMVEATRKIIAALQDRLAGRDRCPFRSGKALREDATPLQRLDAATVERWERAQQLDAEIARLRGLLIDPGSPPWEDARAVLVAELRKIGFDTHADNVAAGHGVMIPSDVALNLIAHARKG